MTSTIEPQALISAEKQFLFRDAYNKGYIQLPRMVISCLCLSEQAKMVYTAISMFIYEQGKTAFPSVHRMGTMCGMSAKSVIKYVKELEDKNFIKKVRRGNGLTNDYCINDLHEVKALYVSEQIWKVLDSILSDTKENIWEQLDGAWKKYLRYASKSKINLTTIECSEEVLESIKKDLLAIMEGREPTMNLNIPSRPRLTKTAGEVKVQTDKEGKSYKDRHESEWRLVDFRNHFYEKYQERTQMVHANVEKIHTGIMSRMLKQLDGDKSQLKEYIDAFFEIGYDNPSMETFGTSGRFAEIATFLKDGKKPFYIGKKTVAEKKEQEAKAEQQYQGLDEDEFIKRLKERRGGRK